MGWGKAINSIFLMLSFRKEEDIADKYFVILDSRAVTSGPER